MSKYPKTMEDLIRFFARFPGVGPRSAERMAFYLLNCAGEEAKRLTELIEKFRQTIRYCESCFNLSEHSQCEICTDPMRDHKIICVVESPRDIIAIERGGSYRGVYHVLLGNISPLDGIGPKDLKIQELLGRIKREEISEAILATGSDTEGETTALYLVRLLKPLQVAITRIAYGVAVGANLEFADRASLSRAFEARQPVQQ
ncbi:MAG: recombination protein RecR [Candidatus Omnitrophica bacterium]|nr:recombination protein RecR [Candidatus Omnitrophota bacterium]